MPASQAPNFIARGDIGPSLFVKFHTTDHGVVVAAAGDEAIGVSHEGTREAPVTGVTPLTAKDGEAVMVYTDTMTCEVIAGADIIVGAKLKPDATGKAITAVATNVYSAIAKAAALNGEKCKCILTVGRLPA